VLLGLLDRHYGSEGAEEGGQGSDVAELTQTVDGYGGMDAARGIWHAQVLLASGRMEGAPSPG
jgi:hypothetical protein